MKEIRICSLLAMSVLLFVSGVCAETVTIDTAAGTTNRLQRVYTGELDLSINSGATGGVVLPRPYSTYSGTTTLGSGTLVVTTPAREGHAGELGAYGPFIQTGGTLQYSGVPGGVWTRPITNSPAVDTAAVVWQIDNDLTMDCDVWQPTGCFIKDGPGTLTFTKPFKLGGCSTKYSGIYNTLTDFSPDRAPTTGYAPFTISDGTVVIDTPNGTNSLSGADINLAIGQGRTLTGEETTGVLILSNGVTRSAGRINIGSSNGYTTNTGKQPEPTIRIVNGASLYVGSSGDCVFYTGVRWYNGGTQWCAPRLEVSGKGSTLSCKGLSVSYNEGASTTVVVSDGGLLTTLSADVTISSNSGSASTTNEIIVTGAGTYLKCRAVNNNKKSTTNVRLLDGGILEMWNFKNGGGGKLNLIVDGGIWRHRNKDGDGPHFPSTMTSVKVGPGGMTTFFNGGAEGYPVIWEKGIEPLDDSGTDGGLHITQGASAMPPLRINAANTYCGPTEISFTRVYLGKNGRLPSGTALSVYGNNGGLIITNGITQTVGSFTFGRDNGTDSPFLGFGPNARLDVTGELHVGDRTQLPKFHLFETQGGTDALVTAGTYTFITAREEDYADLVRLAGCATFPLKPDTVDYVCTADVADGRARLRVTVAPAGSAPAASGDPLILNNTDTNATLTATAEQLAAARSIYTNPGYASNVHGPVELGALTGFAAGGNLVSGSGTTYASDLSFANSVSNITLGFGTLAYTGPDATIPGVTIAASPNRSAVLSITNENTTLTLAEMNVVTGGFTKIGPGTLKLKPPAGTTLVLPRNTSDNSSYNGVTVCGDGPSSGTRAVNLTGGWTEIGTVGDPTDAPDVYGPADFSVGSQSHRNGIAEQTAGSLRINNGSLYVGYLYISYYCGNYASNPELNLTPTIEQNGGLLSCSVFRLAQCNDSNQQTASPRYFLHGGTNIVREAVNAGQSAVAKGHTYRALIDVDGGLMVVSNNFICGNNANAIGVDTSIRGNGRVEVGGIFYPAYANTRDTNTFQLAENGVLRAGTISGYNVNRPLVATFDGGTFESTLPASGYTYITKMNRAYIGAGGLNIDLSQHTEQEVRNNWLVIQQTFDHHPDCVGDDGGINIRGTGSIALSTGLETSTFTGPIRVTDGARVCPVKQWVAPFPLQVAPGCILHDYEGSSMVKDLTLGEADATEPVVLEQLAGGAKFGFIATNDLQILSPVTFTTVQEAHDFQPRLVCGVYTALVYNASCADVDLSLFGLTPADAEFATLAATQVTIADGGEFDGMKAVVLTVTAKNTAGIVYGNVWSSVAAGGTWSTAANWENPDFIPNGSDRSACFNPATAAGVGVTLDAPVTLGDLTFNASSATYGYTLSGSALTLDGSYSTPTVVNVSGTNTIAAPVVLTDGAGLRTTAGNELRLTGGVTGTGALNANTHVTTGAGQVNLSVAPTFTGNVKTGSGRVVMNDLSFIQNPSQLTLGPGNLVYTGPDVELPGLTLSAGASRCAVFDHDSDITLNALAISGTSAFLKRGAGTLRLHGTGTFAPNTYVNHNSTTYATEGIVKANGDSQTVTMRGVTIAKGAIVQGEVDDPANAPTVSLAANELAVGSYTLQGDATYVLNNGKLTGTGTIYVGYYAKSLNSVPTLTYIQNGGTATAAAITCGYTNNKWANKTDVYVEINGGSVVLTGNLNMGRDKAADKTTQSCRFVMNGGTFEVGANLHLAYKANAPKGFADLNGGVVTVKGSLYPAYGANANSTLRLNRGGTLRCNGFAAMASGSTTRFYGNGGEFRPLALTDATLAMPANAFSYLYASTNGLVVNTEEMVAGGTYTVNCPVLHDPECAAGTDGGLTKRGTGILVLPDGNTYLGDTTIEGGVLRVPSAAGFASGKVVLDGGAFEVVSGTIALKGVAGYGDIFCSGVTVTNTIAPCTEGSLYANGDVTLADGVKLDLSAFEDGAFSAKDRLLLVAAEGTASAPQTLRAAPASKMERDGMTVKTEVVGGSIYAVFTYGGTIIMVR